MTESEEENADKSKKKEAEPEKESQTQKILNFFQNPDPKNIAALLAILAIAYFFAKAKPAAKEKTYIEFVNDYMTKNQVKEITITKDNRSDVFNY